MSQFRTCCTFIQLLMLKSIHCRWEWFFFFSKLRQRRSSPSSIYDAVFKALTSLPGFSRPAVICSVAYSILSMCLCCWGSRCWLSCCCATMLLWAIWPPHPSSPSASSAPGKNTHHTDLKKIIKALPPLGAIANTTFKSSFRPRTMTTSLYHARLFF